MRWAYLISHSGFSESQLLAKDLNPELIKSLAKALDRILSSIFLATKTCLNPKMRKKAWVTSSRRAKFYKTSVLKRLNVSRSNALKKFRNLN